jgi:hypothetical protein
MMAGFDTTPKPAFLRAMQNQRWTMSGALAELVDNSFGPGRGNADNVWFQYHAKERVIYVLDDGRGMESIGRLFQLGNTIGRSPGDIGMYGSGGTMAVLWLAKVVTVWTLQDGMVSSDRIDWQHQIRMGEFPWVSDSWRRATVSNTPTALLDLGRGTLIKLELLSERKFDPSSVSNVKRDLSKMYAPGLRLGKNIYWASITPRAGKAVDRLADPLLLPDDEQKLVRIDLFIDTGEETLLPITGVIGVIEGLPLNQSVVTVGYGPRVITTTRDCYSSPDGEQRYSGVGVAGWLDLGEGWQPYLSTTKDVMNDKRAWDLLMGYVFDKICHLLELVDDQKLSIELEDLAIMLESAVNGLSRVNLPAGIDSEPGERPEPTGPGPARDNQPTKPEGQQDGDNAERDTPARAQLSVIPESDAVMETLLCTAKRSGEAISVYINKDHELIKTAMKQHPVNRELLRLAALQAVADILIDEPDMMKRLFKSGAVLRSIEGREGRDREGLVLRFLIDRSRVA